RGRGSARLATRLLCAAAAAAFACGPSLAQTASPDLDPSAPLDPMPDLSVEWPDLNVPEIPVAPVAEPPAGTPAPAGEEPSGERRYSVVVDGLAGSGDTEALLAEFKKRSAL